jgi:phosphatidylglycerophosphatase A
MNIFYRSPFAMNFIIRLLSTGFFCGYIRGARGTYASIIACGIWVFLSNKPYYPIVVGCFVSLGFTITGYAEKKIFNEKDSSKIVIDEMAGMLASFISMLASFISFRFMLNAEGVLYLAAGLILFRFFDIVKPAPVGSFQRLNGGVGIMMDDLVSGALANGILQLVRILVFR